MQTNILFDLDGTLTDSRPGIINCIRFAMEKMGRGCTDDLGWCLGPPLHQSFARLLATEDKSPIERAVALYRERFQALGMFENEVYPQITEALEALSRKQNLFVATSKPRVYAVQILEHFGLSRYFKSIYGSELDGTRSDKHELLAHLLHREGLESQRTVMIGDREHDMRGAKHNGVRALGALWGYGSREELLGSGADQLIAQPGELHTFIL